MDATIKSAFEMGLKVIIPEGTNTTFDNPYMDKEKTYKYYNEFMWPRRFAECISVEESKVYGINKIEFLKLLKNYPEIEELNGMKSELVICRNE